MQKEDLIQSAESIPTCPAPSAEAFGKNGTLLAEKVSDAMLALPDLQDRIGPGNIGLMKDNHRNQAKFFHSLLVNFQPSVLVNTCAWAMGVYLQRGFNPSYWEAMLPLWLEAMRDTLPPEAFADTAPMFEWIRDHRRELLELARQQ
ncbi:MAG: hypothetical protein ACOC29_00315 [Candidatus Sumerlaeota bacterium]